MLYCMYVGLLGPWKYSSASSAGQYISGYTGLIFPQVSPWLKTTLQCEIDIVQQGLPLPFSFCLCRLIYLSAWYFNMGCVSVTQYHKEHTSYMFSHLRLLAGPCLGASRSISVNIDLSSPMFPGPHWHLPSGSTVVQGDTLMFPTTWAHSCSG